MRRRFAFRTAGSAGRSGRSAGSAPNRRPGICLECLPRAVRGRVGAQLRTTGAERLDRGLQPVGQLPRELCRRLRLRDGDRLADQRRERRERDPPRPKAFRVPSSRTGSNGAPVASAIRAAPRSQGPSLPTPPSGKMPTTSPASSAAIADLIATVSLRPRCTGIASTVPSHQRRPAPPQLGLAEVAHRPRDHRREQERVEHRVVIPGDDEPARWRHVLLPAHLDAVDRPNDRCQRATVGLVAQ